MLLIFLGGVWEVYHKGFIMVNLKFLHNSLSCLVVSLIFDRGRLIFDFVKVKGFGRFFFE